ncbi:MAG TPA: hypothetical protein DCS93_02600 [Microscillaceae bacterium]|nr:hypothetical protein [Microscillaceae bacterium]
MLSLQKQENQSTDQQSETSVAEKNVFSQSSIQAKTASGKPLRPVQAKTASGKPLRPIQAKTASGKPLQPIQAKTASGKPLTPIQRKVTQGNTGVTSLPDNLKSGIEQLSGTPMDDVKVHHNSSKPATIQAKAYAQGTDIHLGPGQSQHLPHEAWHVVQQKQGRVEANETIQTKSERTPVNTEASLETEADVMGAKAASLGQSTVDTAPVQSQGASLNNSASPVQRVLREGSDFKQATVDEETVNLIYEKVRGRFSEKSKVGQEITKQQIEKVLTQINNDPKFDVHLEEVPDYIYNNSLFITDRNHGKYRFDVDLSSERREEEVTKSKKTSLAKTIYGTDTSDKESMPQEISEAYNEGYRDFDCAYGYFDGKTAPMFEKLNINKGFVRILYKFKHEQLEGAKQEIARLSAIKGVIIHTLMLHELPVGDEALEEALDALSELSKEYKTNTGVSNVMESGLGIKSDLSNVAKKLEENETPLTSIENRMDPAVPDKKVREYCKKNKIQYLAYGVSGPSTGGTCGKVPGMGNGDFKVLNDPGMQQFAQECGVETNELRYVIYTWARQQGASVITRSSQQGRRNNNKTDLDLDSQGLDTFMQNYEPKNLTEGIYTPCYNYLRGQGVSTNTLSTVTEHIPANWLEIYYKDVIVNLKEDRLTNLLVNYTNLLSQSPGTWEDLTKLREWLGDVIIESELEQEEAPSTATITELIDLSKTSGFVVKGGDYTSYLKLQDFQSAIGNKDLSTIYFHDEGNSKLFMYSSDDNINYTKMG